MAKDAHDREDLLKEASAFPWRIELSILDGDPTEQAIVCGLREQGAMSLYWAQATVLHFNTEHELRRAYWMERLVGSYNRELHWLSQSKRSARVQLIRTIFSDSESVLFRSNASRLLGNLRAAFANEAVNVRGQFPIDHDVRQTVIQWLDHQPLPIKFAIHPGIGRRQKTGRPNRPNK